MMTTYQSLMPLPERITRAYHWLMRRVLWFLILTLVVPIFHPTIANAREIDTSDNKFPVLISVNLDKQNYLEGDTGLVTIIIRDDKNELATWPYIWFGVPSGSPGSVSGDFVNGGRGLIDTQITDTYVQQTFSFTFTIPTWAGNYYGYNIQGVSDKNKNQAGYDLRNCSNNNIYRTTQVASFPNIVPICNTSFTVTLLTPEQKAATKAAAELKAKQEAEAKAPALKRTTITCVKGKLTKKVIALKPKCPSGYKLKK
jgi:hypothetical protein